MAPTATTIFAREGMVSMGRLDLCLRRVRRCFYTGLVCFLGDSWVILGVILCGYRPPPRALRSKLPSSRVPSSSGVRKHVISPRLG